MLVQGAAGAVGYYAAQLARLAGARPIATVGSPAQERLVREAGVAQVIDRKREDVAEPIARRLPLSKIVEAHEAMEAGHLNGKLILDVP